MQSTTGAATVYTTYGSVCGWCPHTHRSYAAAEACVRADQRRCRRQGGYSDRVVLAGASRADLDAQINERLGRGW